MKGKNLGRILSKQGDSYGKTKENVGTPKGIPTKPQRSSPPVGGWHCAVRGWLPDHHDYAHILGYGQIFRKGEIAYMDTEPKPKFELENIRECLSNERLHSYFFFLPEKHHKRAVIPYDWIQMLSSMLFIPLQYFEITLRNKINITLTQHYQRVSSKKPLGGNSEDWLKWMPNNQKTHKDVALAYKTATQDIKGRKVLIGDIISRLQFGVWLRVLEEHPDVNAPYHFWSFIKAKLFPNLPKGTTRKTVLIELRSLNILRNRLFHYEPIWNYAAIPNFHQGIAEIRRKYMQIMNAINWLSTDVHNFILQSGHVKRFDDTAIEISQFLDAVHKHQAQTEDQTEEK